MSKKIFETEEDLRGINLSLKSEEELLEMLRNSVGLNLFLT